MYEFDSKVRYSELAEDKKLSPVSIINYFQDCCTFEAEEKGVGLKVLDKNHTAWMLINWHIKIDRRPDFNEKRVFPRRNSMHMVYRNLWMLNSKRGR